MTVLVIAAHPDDEVLGCGGTIARLTAEGEEVHVQILGEGVSSRGDRREDARAEEITALHANSISAAKVLGITDLSNEHLPDNRFDSVDLLDIVKLIESKIDTLKPSVLYTQHGGDLNIDHVLVYRASLIATRPIEGSPVKTVYAYPVASSTEWALNKFVPPFRPTVFVDIQEKLELKIQAMECYRSESRQFPHPRSSEALRAAAVTAGSLAGLVAAEAFELVRDIR